MSDRPTFILLAGAMQPAWVWHRVVPLLRDAGFGVLASDLPGMGEDRTVPVETVTLSLWTDFVCEQVRSVDGPVILVGHSRAGVIVGEAAERLPDLVTGIIYVCGIAVPPGRTAVDVMKLDLDAQDLPTVAGGKAYALPPEVVISIMYQRCDPADTEQLATRLSPEPLEPILAPASVTMERWGRVPRAYVQTGDDRTLSLERQQTIVAEAGCHPVVTLDADHSPFLSATGALAAVLIALAGQMPVRT